MKTKTLAALAPLFLAARAFAGDAAAGAHEPAQNHRYLIERTFPAGASSTCCGWASGAVLADWGGASGAQAATAKARIRTVCFIRGGCITRAARARCP